MANDSWRTPNTQAHPVIDLCEKVFDGKIDIDVTADNDKSVPAEFHITEEMNFLKNKLEHLPFVVKTAFMNPPFSQPAPFVERLAQLFLDGTVMHSIALLKAGSLHNKATGTIIRESATAACLWGAGKSSRIAFLDADGVPVKGANFDCSLVYWGDRPHRFMDVFSDYGLVFRI